MATVEDVYALIDSFAPFSSALDWDNVGVLVGPRDKQVHRILLALDATGGVVDEAVERGADLIVTHHPVLFKPISQIAADSIAYRLVREGIPVLCAHTNLDIAEGGVNDALARRLGLENLRPLEVVEEVHFRKVVVYVPQSHTEAVYQAMVEAGGGVLGDYRGCCYVSKGEGRFVPVEGASPAIGGIGRLETVLEGRIEMTVHPDRLNAVVAAMRGAHPYEMVAFDVYPDESMAARRALGRVGELGESMTPSLFAAYVKDALRAGGVKYMAGSSMVRTVAVCGGSGGGYLPAAKRAGAQALVTGDTKYDQMLEAARLGLTLLDGNHFHTEYVVLEPLMERLQEGLPGVETTIARASADQVRYLGFTQ